MSKNKPENFRLDDQIGHVLRNAYHKASAHFARRLRRQFATLARLHELGPTPQNRLGETVSMPRANIRTMVERLRARGLVEIRADPDDCRLRIVALTEAGSEMVETLIPLDIESTRDALAPLDASEQRELYRLLGKL